MKIEEIDRDSLLYAYLPADYCDSFSREFRISQISQLNKPDRVDSVNRQGKVGKAGKEDKSSPAMNPDMFLNIAFKQYPFWIKWLLNLRNILVKSFGLDTSTPLEDTIRAKNENEIVFGMEDKHLTFYVSLWCGQKEEISTQTEENINAGIKSGIKTELKEGIEGNQKRREQNMQEKEQNIQELIITTIVRYNNWFGRVYFFVISPFHKIIIRSMLNRVVKFVIKQG